MSCGCNGNPGGPCQYTQVGKFPDEIGCSAGSIINNFNDLRNFWATSANCPDVFSTILYSGENGVRTYNKNMLPRIQSNINNLMNRYLSFGFDFTSVVSSPKYDPFQESLINLCANPTVPGGCDLFLQNYCNKFSRDEIGSDRALASLCGCYAPPKYESIGVTGPCDPLCHLARSTQIPDFCTGVITRCSNTVCVIDDVTIDLVNTTGGGTAFQQICPGCEKSGADPCTCIISGVNVRNTLQKSGVGATYTQFCGENAQCFTNDQNGRLIEVECPPESSFPGPPVSNSFYIVFIVIGIAIFILIIIVIIFLATKTSSRKVELRK